MYKPGVHQRYTYLLLPGEIHVVDYNWLSVCCSSSLGLGALGFVFLVDGRCRCLKRSVIRPGVVDSAWVIANSAHFLREREREDENSYPNRSQVGSSVMRVAIKIGNLGLVMVRGECSLLPRLDDLGTHRPG